MTTPVVRNDANYTGALFSFLRVLATNVATALLPLFLLNDQGASDYPAGKALILAVVTSTLLTVINFLRAGETRFGTPPNVVATES